MDTQELFVWRAGVVKKTESGACCVCVYVFGRMCPAETHVRQHACERPGHRPEEITFVNS